MNNANILFISTMRNREFYRPRKQPETFKSDSDWLMKAREIMDKAADDLFVDREWPLRAAKVTKMLQGIRYLQYSLQRAAEEAYLEAHDRVMPHDDITRRGYRW